MKLVLLTQYLKDNKLTLMQMLSFIAGKIVLAIVQLPQYQKTQNFLPQLTVGVLFFGSALALKLKTISKLIVKEVLLVNIQSFLLWIVASLIMIFSFSLSDALKWSSLQKLCLLLVLFLETAVLILFCNWRYTSKTEFVVYEAILSVCILALGIKTVVFIAEDKASQNKDIVLLNLTTQIAFSILIMDSIEKGYKRYLDNSKSSQKKQMEQQLTMNA